MMAVIGMIVIGTMKLSLSLYYHDGNDCGGL